ncbi:MAG: pseudouridine synthase [Candidatus Gracilibacteria bacterium]|nr:pseudouridine synthase [Candidatus Gracilibacteria bacterium]
MSNLVRLNKYLAECGVSARRKADELIAAGKVKLNGKIVRELGVKIDPNIDQVEYAGNLLGQEKKIYIMLNKPAGYITAVSDDRDSRLVTDLVKVPFKIFPVGRLDKDTTGLLLLTNDGELANRLMHPRYEHDKTYQINLQREITDAALERLARGVELEDGMTAPAQAKRLGEKKISLTIHEGRKRQVKRMIEVVHNKVVSLKRVEFAGLVLETLKVGEWRFLKEDEVKILTERSLS